MNLLVKVSDISLFNNRSEQLLKLVFNPPLYHAKKKKKKNKKERTHFKGFPLYCKSYTFPTGIVTSLSFTSITSVKWIRQHSKIKKEDAIPINVDTNRTCQNDHKKKRKILPTYSGLRCKAPSSCPGALT